MDDKVDRLERQLFHSMRLSRHWFNWLLSCPSVAFSNL